MIPLLSAMLGSTAGRLREKDRTGSVVKQEDGDVRIRTRETRIASIIRASRTAAGLTQAGLADRLTAIGVPTARVQVVKWEWAALHRDQVPTPNQAAVPRADRLLAILEVTGPDYGDETALLRGQVAQLEEQIRALRRQLIAGQ